VDGVFQIDRTLFDNPIWNNVTEFRLFFYILGHAVFSDDGVKMGDVHIKKGQYLRSFRNLREDLMYVENNSMKHYSISTIKRTVDKLISDGRLEIKDTKLGTLFTVVNYEYYQGFERFNKDSLEHRWNSVGTPAEHLRNNNKKDNKDKKENYTDYKSVYEHYKTLGLKNHRAYTEDMKKAIESAMKNNKYDIEYCMTLLDRHKELVELTKNDEKFAVKPRSIQQFFGQKAFNAKHLICSEYDIDGEKYLRLQELKKKKTDPGDEQIPTLVAMQRREEQSERSSYSADN
jgi:hypothetical protein